MAWLNHASPRLTPLEQAPSSLPCTSRFLLGFLYSSQTARFFVNLSVDAFLLQLPRSHRATLDFMSLSIVSLTPKTHTSARRKGSFCQRHNCTGGLLGCTCSPRWLQGGCLSPESLWSGQMPLSPWQTRCSDLASATPLPSATICSLPKAWLWCALLGQVDQQQFGRELLPGDRFLELWHLDISLCSQLDLLSVACLTLGADQSWTEGLLRGQSLPFVSVMSP